MSLEARLQVAATEYQKLQTDLTNIVEVRQQLEAQLTENEQVKKEFGTLKSTNTVYKLIGPVLVKQDQAEAKANVDKRLEFIQGEIKRVEALIKEISEKCDKKKSEIVEIQAAHQQIQAQQQPAPAIA